MSPMLAAGFTSLGEPHRLAEGGLIDRTVRLPFRFDGQDYFGHPGDTLASALVANGVRLLGRSFKYHRPRGLLAAGPEEPNALMELGTGPAREPNIPATVVELVAGLEAHSQNRWPSLRTDLMAVNGLFGPLFAAGFYYKTFMWPASFWERVYEPLIRRAAGLGRAPVGPDPDTYGSGHLHTDVLVVGAGPAGLAAALAAARAGARVILADEDSRMGGRLLAEREVIDNQPGHLWAEAVLAELAALPNVRLLPRTTVFGAYDSGTHGAVERTPGAAHRQTYWRIVARRTVLATGAIERPLVFPGNDRPGVMLAGAARAFVNRWAARPGRRAVVATAGPDGWRTVADLQAAGIEVAAVVTPDAAAPPRADLAVFAGGRIAGTHGRRSLAAVTVTDALGAPHRIPADLLLMAGGWSPTVALACHTGTRPAWDEAAQAFLVASPPPGMSVVGAAAGRTGLRTTMEDGARAGSAAAGDLGFTARPVPLPTTEGAEPAPSPLWLPPTPGRKAFVDFQHDVTASDVALAHREGFRAVEHLKRYTTLGMATDGGKSSNLNGLALMAALTGRGIAETGTTLHRAPTTPVTIGALAAHSVGPDFRPTRHTPAHAWATEQGASMMNAGAWIRAAFFPRATAGGTEDWQAAALREATAVRTAAGLCDVSTLGKIELMGADVPAFLDRLYVNTFSTLKPGRVRYGLMLREDGFVMDDGTVARLAPDRWVMTTTTAQAAAVLAHMEFCHQVLWPGLDVHFATVTDQWAQFSLAGPRARDILAAALGTDLSDAALPHMGCVTLGTTRLFRLSFSGELAYEVAVPAGQGNALARTLMEAGRPHGLTPYGIEALTVLRIEKGHPAGGELDGRTTARDLGMARMMSTRKDYIGRALAQRPVLMGADRPTLVGLVPVDRTTRLRSGAHLLRPGAPATPENDEGWISSATWSPALGHPIALGFLANGPARHGERVRAYDPIRNGDTTVEVVAPCFVDPQGSRLHPDGAPPHG